jgi:C-terminal processing protease CtpA/Prc
MVGRLNAERRIMVGGVGTAPEFVPVINQLKGDFTIKYDSAGIGPSDHTSFYLKNIPVLFFFTGQHSDYHKPTDDTDKINFPGEKAVLELAAKVVNQLDKTPKLKFQETTSKQEKNPSFSVTLGIMPDYTYDGIGLHVDGVTNGKTGFIAGLQKGDVIVKMGDLDVKNIQDYMKGLAMFKKGDSTSIVVKRGAEDKKLNVTFQ